MRRGLPLLLLLAAGLAAARPGTAQHDMPFSTVQALPITEPLQVDGQLDEEVWSQAQVASGFTQREKPDEPATEPTEFMVVYTPTMLYIGFRCFDSQPEGIVARELERDGRLFRDDAVIVVIDTFHDHRNSYFLEVNPAGAILDALSEEGRSLNSDWDGVWNAAARITPDGWTAEMAIPFSTLRFDPSLDTWGFNVRRLVARKAEQSYWVQVGRDASLVRMSRAGHLTGLKGLESGLNLRLKPFAVGSQTDFNLTGLTNEESDLGMDVKWGITRGLALDLTYNTDFAEAEADDQQVNLTRFSLFLREKREFFLENAGIFEFVPPSQIGATPPLEVFFSRRIGIAESGVPVPIRWGTRLTGRAGDWSIGVLDVSTEDMDQASSGVLGGIQEDNWGVVRVKRNVGERSAVGMIFTNRDQEDVGSSQVYGLDANLNPLPKLNVNTFFAASRTSNPFVDDIGVVDDEQDQAGGASMVWNGQYWLWAMEAMEIGDSFDPQVGFLLRNGIRRYAPTVFYKPRPKVGNLRSLLLDAQAEIITDLDDRLETFAGRLDFFGFILDSEDQVQTFIDINRERLVRPFAIRPGIVIPPGEYDFNDFGVTYATNPYRQVFVTGSVLDGQFFDGERFSNVITVGWRASRYFRAETRWTRDEVDLPAGSFTANVWRQRLSLSPTPRLSTNAFIQYNDSADLVSLNLRFNWIYKPGSDIFLVYNHNWIAPGLGDLGTRERQAILKFTYLLSL